MYSVIYQPQAENDLIDILVYYTEQGGYTLGETIFDRIKTHIDRLDRFPYRTTESETIADAREFLIEKLPYKAYILIEEEAKTVRVVRILHTAKNTP